MHTSSNVSIPNISVSVIIPTLNAGEQLRELLRRLQEQTLPPLEIIVIDSESTDATLDIARAAGAKIMNVKKTEFDHGGTRNRAAAAASGHVLMFMTQDAMPQNNRLIEQLTMGLSDSEGDDGLPVMAYARQLPKDDATLLEKLTREHNYPDRSYIREMSDIDQFGIKTFFCSNVCSAIPKAVFVQQGGFQEPVMFNEDLFMSAKCILDGRRVAYRAEAIVKHSHNYSIRQQFNRYFDNGISMKMNRWITMYSAVGAAGSSLVKQQARALIASGHIHLLPKLILDSAAKLVGYKLGLHFNKLPKRIVRKLSMHPRIWHHINTQSSSQNFSD
ncbi:glycosyltransferase family 2 protein [Paenibacillus sp. strain BS8-2]